MLHNPMPIKYILKDNTAETETKIICGVGLGNENGLTANKQGKNFAG